MKEIRPIYWIGALVLACCVLFFMAAYFAAPTTGDKDLSKKQENAVNATIAKELKTDENKTKQAEAATKAADKSQLASNKTRQQAIHYHQQARAPHAKPAILTDALVDSVQLALTKYPY